MNRMAALVTIHCLCLPAFTLLFLAAACGGSDAAEAVELSTSPTHRA